MCGICGILDFTGDTINPSILWDMTRTLCHRGPDDSGIEIFKQAGLGHTRLSIIDLSVAGHQPMKTRSGRFTIVYNGEIYNFKAIRERLEKQRILFSSNSDTEVVLEAFATWGIDAFTMFNGMYALAIWDDTEQRLTIARDRFGIKPLYYLVTKSGIIFGSEIKAILAIKSVNREICLAGLHEYLWYGVALGENTLLEGIKKLLPGHYAVINRKGCDIKPYWKIDETKPIYDSEENAVLSVRDKFEAAVKDHLVSDVPVGVFLSGGIDSSSIVAIASKYYQGKLSTYSVGFDYEKGVNELPKADLVAKTFATNHHEVHVSVKNVPQLLDKLLDAHDQPFGDAANIPLYLLCDQLTGSTKVVLQGDGGDEIFAGYRRYNVLRYQILWCFVAKVAAISSFFDPPFPWFHRYQRFLSAIKHSDPADRMALLLSEETNKLNPARVLSRCYSESLKKFNPFQRYYELNERLSHLEIVQRMLYTDCSILLPDIFLEKVDRSTMSHGIEVRVPFLDSNLTNYALGLPSAMKVSGGQKKRIFRKAMRGILPDTILDGPKTGFGVPYKHWLRTEMAQFASDVLLGSASSSRVLDLRVVSNLLADHVSGKKDNGFMLWKLLNLILWMERTIN